MVLQGLCGSWRRGLGAGLAAAVCWGAVAHASIDKLTKAPPLIASSWFNVPDAEPFPGRDHAGKVTLIFFWAAGDPASAHAAQYVRNWFRLYRGRGLEVLGVLSPEFSAQAQPAALYDEVEALRIYFPVAIDSDLKVKRQQGVVSWPAVLVVDRGGFLRGRYEGALPFDSIEHLLETLLTQRGPKKHEEE